MWCCNCDILLSLLLSPKIIENWEELKYENKRNLNNKRETEKKDKSTIFESDIYTQKSNFLHVLLAVNNLFLNMTTTVYKDAALSTKAKVI